MTRAEFEQPRTQAELRRWVDRVYSTFGATKAGKRFFRFNEGELTKEFKEEIWPLARFADAFYEGRTDVVFKPTIGNQSHDALMLNRRTESVSHYLQIAQSFDGEQEHLRMRHLEDHGRAPATGARLPRTPKTQPVPEIWADAVSHADARQQTFERILKVVEKKSLKGYEANTFLIVEFESLHVESQADREALDKFAKDRLLPLAQKFRGLYLVSDTGAVSLSYDLTAT